MIYLDNNASTMCDPLIAKDLYSNLLDQNQGNPHSTEHAFGWKAATLIENAKDNIAQNFNALADDVIFTSGASESNALVVVGLAQAGVLKNLKRTKIIISEIEHKCILNSAHHAQTLFNIDVVTIPVNKDGIVDLDFLTSVLDDTTLLVSVMATNNEIGVNQPITEIGKMVHQVGAFFHVDAAQAGYQTIDMITDNIDMLSISGHKIYAPKGVGALIIDQTISLLPQPIIHGGNQQNGLRSGTLSPALCQSLSDAMTLLNQNKVGEIQHLNKLRQLFLQSFSDNKIEFTINGSLQNRHPGNLNIQLHNINASTLINNLQPHLAISTGSACNSGIISGSYVLKALGLTQEEINTSIRIGFGRFNTEEEITQSVNLIINCISSL